MTTVLLADDHEMNSQGLKVLIEGKGFRVIGLALNGTDAVNMTFETKPDIVIMDISMPDLNGIEATDSILKKLPETKIIALSRHADKHFIYKMFSSGAVGYVHKESAVADLYDAIEAVLDEGYYVSPSLARTFDITQDAPFISNERKSKLATLSKKERQVLQMVAEGKKNKLISEKMGLSVRTIETHRRNIMKKLGIYSVAGLTKFAIKEGIVDLDSI